jgi:MSHA biogenesis protein MshI
MLTMRWPWKRIASGDQLIASWSGQTLAYVRARVHGNGFKVLQMGVERQGSDTREDFVRRILALGLKGYSAHIMLRPEQYQFLQIDAPSVAPEELRSAARYQVRDMVDSHLDDVTLDVMRLGAGQEKGQAHLFVVAANTAIVKEVLDLGASLQWDVTVIDVQETAQRNLQSLVALREGRTERATAALLLSDSRQAVLTISADEELYYTRRLDVPEGFLDMAWGHSSMPAPEAEGFMPVDEYVPDYSVGGVAYGNDYSEPRSTASAAAVPSDAQADLERAQRFLVEVQRSLDLWDRSWSSLPLGGLRVFAGARSAELAKWLGSEMGQTVGVLDVTPQFTGLDAMAEGDQAYCLPLLGVLLRTESRKL